MERILLIDDDSCVRLWAERSLKREGYEIYTAAEIKSGLNLALQERPDLILLDLHMPGDDGLQALRTLKKSRYTCSIPVVMFTADDLLSSMEQALELGAEGYIVKFDNSHTIAHHIQRILARGPLGKPATDVNGRTMQYH